MRKEKTIIIKNKWAEYHIVYGDGKYGAGVYYMPADGQAGWLEKTSLSLTAAVNYVIRKINP